MLEIFDKQRNLIGILQHAYALSEELKINSVNYFSFSLPYNDPKNALCEPFNFIRFDGGELYRILPSEMNLTEDGDVKYKCEHVLASLIDNVMFGEHIVGNRGYYTRNVLAYILDKQLVKNWILGDCDFAREFEYAWTGESLLTALFSVPKPFADKYIWTFNTKNYPYIINLKKIDENKNPELYIRPKKNMLRLAKRSDPTSICTRLYPLGYGEGINQLNIKRLTGGVPYIQSPYEYIAKYGIIERVWIDRRYTNEESLYAAAKAMLEELEDPFEEYETDFALLGEDSFDAPELGKIVEIVGYKKTFITGIDFNYDDIKTSKLSIANRPKDIAGTIADMQDRQRIEMAYSQGATQFYQDHVYDNADASTSLVLKLMLPEDMKIINAINIDVEVSAFRKPFTVTGGGGAQIIDQSNTTSSGSSSESTTLGGGGQTISQSNNTSSGSSSLSTTYSGGGSTSGSSSSSTTDSGGDVSKSTISGGGTSLTSSSGGAHSDTARGDENAEWGDRKTSSFEDADGNSHTHSVRVVTLHGHRFSIPNHFHQVKIPEHSHNFSIPTHSHAMRHTHNIYSHEHSMPHTHSISHTHYIANHVHDMSHTHGIFHTHAIPDHRHELDPGISFSGNPSGFYLVINGVTKAYIPGLSLKQDITIFLLDENNMIPRNVTHKIEILPEAPNLLVLGAEQTGSPETVKLIKKENNVLTVERGFQGPANVWEVGTSVSRNFTAYDHDIFKENIEYLEKNRVEKPNNPLPLLLEHNMNSYPVIIGMEVTNGAGFGGAGEIPAGGENISMFIDFGYADKNNISLVLAEKLTNPVVYKIGNIFTVIFGDNAISYQFILTI